MSGRTGNFVIEVKENETTETEGTSPNNGR
jgi:hypothetical protein